MKKFYVVDHETISEAWPELKEQLAEEFFATMKRYRTSSQAAYNALAHMRAVLLDDTQVVTQAEWDARFGSSSKEAV